MCNSMSLDNVYMQVITIIAMQTISVTQKFPFYRFGVNHLLLPQPLAIIDLLSVTTVLPF